MTRGRKRIDFGCDASAGKSWRRPRERMKAPSGPLAARGTMSASGPTRTGQRTASMVR